MNLLLASHNKGKIHEVGLILADHGLSITPADQFPELAEDVVEDGQTFLENALIKARWAANLTGLVTLADDSGLEVEALGLEPGVRSARYSDPEATTEKNNAKLLRALSGVPFELRQARFRCVAVLFVPSSTNDRRFDELVSSARAMDLGAAEEGVAVKLLDGTAVYQQGQVEGVITDEAKGSGGFGYDPLFFLPDQACTVAELDDITKNSISHRGVAFRKLATLIARLT